MNNNLVIIGASALGREVYTYACDCGMRIKGFLDSRMTILEGYAGYPPILSSVEDYLPESGDVFVCAIGEALQRERYVKSILAKAGHFISIIHPSAIIGKNVTMGVGCIVRPFSYIGNDTTLGNHVIIGVQALLAHDCQAADFVTMSPGCHVAGWCRLHSRTFLGIHSAVCPHVELGGQGDVFVAAGAMVTHSFQSGRLMGVPAVQK